MRGHLFIVTVALFAHLLLFLPLFSSNLHCFPLILFTMTAGPKNIGIKAIEIYFPSQVRPLTTWAFAARIRENANQQREKGNANGLDLGSMWSRANSKSLTAPAPASTPLAWARPKCPSATTAKVRILPVPLDSDS